MKPDFEKPDEVVKSDSSDDELEASQMSLYKKIRQSIKKTNSKDSNESSPPLQNSAPSFLPNNAPCDAGGRPGPSEPEVIISSTDMINSVGSVVEIHRLLVLNSKILALKLLGFKDVV